MSQFKLTELAQEDLLARRDKVVIENGKRVARRILRELNEKFLILVDFPQMGRARPDLTDEEAFFFPFYSWLSVYNPESRPLQIIRIVSAYRDPENFLE